MYAQLLSKSLTGILIAFTPFFYALDSTTIDLCLSLFPWAKFRKHKGAIKLHTLMDLRGSIPSFIKITEGKVHDINVLDDLIPEPASFYVMDRGYLDFARLYNLTLASTQFYKSSVLPYLRKSPFYKYLRIPIAKTNLTFFINNCLY